MVLKKVYKEAVLMNHDESIQRNVEDFSRIQVYMQLCEKDSAVYKEMKRRYIELKVILSSQGVNLTELDVIKE